MRGDNLNDFYKRISKNSIIASVYELDKLNNALNSNCEIIFLLTGNIFNLKEISNRVQSKNKGLYIYVDSIDGFSKDTWGLEYIVKNICPDGIITSKQNLIKLSKEMGVFTIQRLFIFDSNSLSEALHSLKNNRPHVVELLPGIMPNIIKDIISNTKLSLIASGLIRDKNDLDLSFKAGAIAVASSKENIWII